MEDWGHWRTWKKKSYNIIIGLQFTKDVMQHYSLERNEMGKAHHLCSPSICSLISLLLPFTHFPLIVKQLLYMLVHKHWHTEIHTYLVVWCANHRDSRWMESHSCIKDPSLPVLHQFVIVFVLQRTPHITEEIWHFGELGSFELAAVQ